MVTGVVMGGHASSVITDGVYGGGGSREVGGRGRWGVEGGGGSREVGGRKPNSSESTFQLMGLEVDSQRTF